MNKTVKKGKRGSQQSETRKSFIVTESGLVETDDDPSHQRKESMKPKSGSIIQEIQDGRHGSVASIAEETEKLLKDFSLKNRRRQSRNSVFETAEKMKARNGLQIPDPKKESEDGMMRELIQTNPSEAIDEIKAKFYSKNVDTMMGYFMTTKAIAIMGTERRKRKNLLKGVSTVLR